MASTSIPRTMKGVIINKAGGPENLQYRTDLPVPVPQADEVLVKNDFIGVNYVDMYVLSLLLFSIYPQNRCL
jgi:NADPH2:quinone reductase